MDVAELRRTFASRIRKLREGQMNQGEFADSVGISRGAMSYYEQEARTPDIGVLRAICTKYNISADYLLGIIPDPNHRVSDICRETGLSPEAARKLNLIAKLISAGELRSWEHGMEVFDRDFNEDFIEVMKIAAFSSLTEVLNVLLENNDGLELLTLLGAIIFGAEIEGSENINIKIKSASKIFGVSYPIENVTAALWVNIQSSADELRKKLQASTAQTG